MVQPPSVIYSELCSNWKSFPFKIRTRRVHFERDHNLFVGFIHQNTAGSFPCWNAEFIKPSQQNIQKILYATRTRTDVLLNLKFRIQLGNSNLILITTKWSEEANHRNKFVAGAGPTRGFCHLVRIFSVLFCSNSRKRTLPSTLFILSKRNSLNSL